MPVVSDARRAVSQGCNLVREVMNYGRVHGFPALVRKIAAKIFEKGKCFLFSIKGYTYVTPQRPDNFDSQISELFGAIAFSIVVPVYNTPPSLLNKLLDSVYRQWYPNWELILVNDGGTSGATQSALKEIHDHRVRVVSLESNKGISGATNEGIKAARNDFIVFLDHDDELTEDCLFELACCINREQPDFIYSDEDKITEKDGYYTAPHFKPDWSPDTLMSIMYTGHVSCVRRILANKVGGLRSEYDGSQDWDFVLRVSEHTRRISHIPKVLYHWRMIPGSAAAKITAKPYALEASRRAREDALLRRGLAGVVEPVAHVQGYFRVVYQLQGNPLISIIIASRDNCTLLRQCVSSIFEKTSYKKFELVIIDNGSTDPETLQYLQEINRLDCVKLIRHDAPFNYSELNNIGAKAARGDLLLFLNDDTRVLQSDWLERLGGFAQLQHVGAVGAKLLYPGNNLVQHAGILNLECGPLHAFRREHADAPGYFMRNILEYNWVAVTGACLMIAREKFQAINGFCESLLVAYNDIDLCMRLASAGYYNVVCQAVRLIHYESATRGMDSADPEKMKRALRELASLYERNPDYYKFDPFHNPNLRQNGTKFELPF